MSKTSTPLELAQEIVSDRFNEFNTSVAFGVVKSLAQALIESDKQREPVEVKRAPEMMSCPDRCGACGEYCGHGDKANFCPNCGIGLKWTKEKA